MRALTHFSVPIKGLKDGGHHYQIVIENDFFKKFEKSIVKKGSFQIDIELLKKSNHIEIDFIIEGTMKTDCDRCLANIDLPVEGNHKLIVKFTVDEINNEEEVWAITYDTHELNLDKAIYEFVNLSVPLIKRYDCEFEDPRPCNLKATNYLDRESEEEEDDDDNEGNPFAEALKNIELN